MGQTSTGYRVGKQPIAQSFFVAEPTGIYVTKVDLFFQTAKNLIFELNILATSKIE